MEQVYPAEYRVTVEKFPDAGADPAEAPANAVKKSDPLAKYGENSELSAKVSPEKTTFDFPLTSK